jgi:hypothetical protein
MLFANNLLIMIFNSFILMVLIILWGHQFIKAIGRRFLETRGHVAIGIEGYLNIGMA